MSWNMLIVARLLTAGMLVSVVGGLLSSSHWGRPVAPFLSQVTPASQEMMQLVRDEHDLVAGMVKAQLANSNPIVVAEQGQAIATR
jgi:hypothetical protein